MIKKLPAITIGIPFYNAEKTLLDAVRSVFLQTHQNWELILMDDGSTDNSLKLARSIGDARIRVYSDGQNRRLAARLNQITELAKHDFIARMDADDLMSPTRLEHQLEVLSARPDVDLVSTGICSLTDEYQPIGIRIPLPNHLITPRRVLSGNSGIVHASIVGRRSWFLRNKYREDLKRSEDANLWLCAFSKNDLAITFMPHAYYYYRENQSINKAKILIAYAETRRAILNDAGESFSGADKLIEFSRSVAKSAVVWIMDAVGNLEFARYRRNKSLINFKETELLTQEIEKIRGFKLCLKST